MMKPPKRAAMAAQAIRELIAAEFELGDQLPSEAELARRLAVSRVTVREALGQLWLEGLISRRWGVGTFVRQRPGPAAGPFTNVFVDLHDIGSLPHRIAATGRTPSLPHARVEQVPAPPEAAAALGLAPGEPIWRVERCLAIDGTPAIVLYDHVPLRVNGVPFDPGPVTQMGGDFPTLVHATGTRIVRDEARLEAAPAGEGVATLLGVDAGSPVLCTRQTSHADTGTVVLSTRCYYRQEVFSILLVRTVPY
ncbi:GntR family transcriptional regulator [Nonomuraea diastatica]|uniref:GntR family transcriptional regulator n=2 Tax=Nonomuraea diastatica TaxID=1848329 RepID=A0A4R4WQC0_9ACTN|nr:GntR family transcriptional regulator [Nonomuraea diastatica]